MTDRNDGSLGTPQDTVEQSDQTGAAQARRPENEPASKERTPLERAVAGLALRGIGPAVMGGRIADIAVHPFNKRIWYVAVGSGGVWKTINAGVTWTPLFDDQPSFSIGCVTIDPTRPEVIWVGTGEAVGGRHVAWGDGVYRSLDAGKTWRRMGLERSEHIADILIDPDDGDTVFVAAQGPLWSSGGDRGLYRSVDGGETWDAVLTVDDDTGVTSAVFAPGDPDTVYAATYQRRRSVRSFVGGGPGSGIHKSTDGGESWRRITQGLPKGDMGKIGLAVTPAAPEKVYATIEAGEYIDPDGSPAGSKGGEPGAKKEWGFYRSTTMGESWEKRSDHLAGGTGPHYYQELFASPHDEDTVYQVDVFLHKTIDGGRTFRNLEAVEGGRYADKHADNHVVWIDPDDADHLLVGCDGGLYETFDDGKAWRHVSNLPISQFYRVAVDNSVPFTNVLGGAQDLGTLYGPTRTTNADGIRNQDWSVPLWADGYQAAFDPEDPNVAYMEWQVGNVVRLDRRTLEFTDVQPQPGPDDPPERWNWDTPIVISPHSAATVYVASQRVWRSDDRGDSWNPISDDLTEGANRYELITGDRVWSVDALYDHGAMSYYATISCLTESPVVDGLLYAGTDDGRVQIGTPADDGSTAWRRAGDLPALPAEAFINDVEACRHDGDRVFVAADDHKSGDYAPYLYESSDRGATWRSIRGDLPDGAVVWKIDQDHEQPDLLFAGTERGLFVSLDRGTRWHRFGQGVPTISFRDLAIQRRDDDLVGATFGRGFYVLDDYSPLRVLAAANGNDSALHEDAIMFPVRDAWRYVPYTPMQAPGQPTLGSTAFRAPNPPFGATVTYHISDELAEGLRTAHESRRTEEARYDRSGDDVPFPGVERLWAEHVETAPNVLLRVRDTDGTPIRTIEGARTAGMHRTTWDLRFPAPHPVDLSEPEFKSPWAVEPRGPLAPAGRYSVELVRVDGDGRVELIAGPESFDVVTIPDADKGADGADIAFQLVANDLVRRVDGVSERVESLRDRLRHLRAGLIDTPVADPRLFAELQELHRRIEAADRDLNGDPIQGRLSEPESTSIRWALHRVAWLMLDNTGPPTATQRAVAERAGAALDPLSAEVDAAAAELDRLTAEIDAAGGPWTRR